VSKVAVYIGTTNGPVRIERISNEPAPLTEVCKGRDIVALMPISEDYENFVRPGRPVERAFGPFSHPSFRMDVSGEIKSGQSWRLAVFVAHGLVRDSRLAHPGDDVDQVVWLTGRVNTDFQVETVGHIEEKLHASKDLFAECAAQGSKISIFLPAGDVTPEGGAVERVSTVFEILHKLGIGFNSAIDGTAIIPAERSAPACPEKKREAKKLLIAVGTVVALLAVSAWAGYTDQGQKFINTLSASAQPPMETPVKTVPRASARPLRPKPVQKTNAISTRQVAVRTPLISVYERRPPAGGTCADVQFSGKPAKEILIGDSKNGISEIKASHGLCGLNFAFVGDKAAGQFIGRLDVLTGRYVAQRGESRDIHFEGQGAFDIDLPRTMNDPFSYRLTLYRPSQSTGPIVTLSHTVAQGQ